MKGKLATSTTNPFRINGILHKATYNRVRMLHCIYWGDTGYVFKKYIVFLSLKTNFVLANSANLNEMAYYAAFHLGFHCLPKYPLVVSGLQRVNAVFLLALDLSWNKLLLCFECDFYYALDGIRISYSGGIYDDKLLGHNIIALVAVYCLCFVLTLYI